MAGKTGKFLISAAFIVWSAVNYLAYYSDLLSSGYLARTFRRLAGF